MLKSEFFKSLVTSINYLIGAMYRNKPFFIVFEGVEVWKIFSKQKLFNYLKKKNQNFVNKRTWWY